MGFEFNGQSSDDFNSYFVTNSIPIIASKRSESFEVQGRDGQYIFEDGYDNIIIRLKGTLASGSTILTRRKIARQIALWLSITGTLVFDYEPDIEYDVVKITNNINKAIRLSIDEFVIEFECKPYQVNTYYNDSVTWGEATSTWENMEIPWGGYDRSFDVSASDTIDVINAGTYKALPIIKLTGTATTVTIGALTFENLAGEIFIDCLNSIVYELSGPTKVNRISDFSGDFITLDPGSNLLDISGTITTLNVEFDYRNTFL